MGLNLQEVGADISAARRRQFRQSLQHRRAQLQSDPAAQAGRAVESRSAQGHLRHRAGRQTHPAQHDRHDQEQDRAALAQPFPAAQRRHHQRHVRTAARSGPASSSRTKRPRFLPKGYTIDYTGESRQFRVEGDKFLPAFGLAVVLIFLVLAAQFNSFRDPLIILLGSVPLAHVRRAHLHFLENAGPGHAVFHRRA